MNRKPRLRSNYELLKYSGLGLELGANVVIGLVIGRYLDGKFSTGPWLTVVFLGLGFASAVRALLRAVKALSSEDGARDAETPQEGADQDGAGHELKHGDEGNPGGDE